MATAAIGENGKIWRQRFYNWNPPSPYEPGWWYYPHSVSTVRTVGYTSEASAISAAEAAAGAGVVANWNLDSPGLWSITVETDTVGELTPEVALP